MRLVRAAPGVAVPSACDPNGGSKSRENKEQEEKKKKTFSNLAEPLTAAFLALPGPLRVLSADFRLAYPYQQHIKLGECVDVDTSVAAAMMDTLRARKDIHLSWGQFHERKSL